MITIHCQPCRLDPDGAWSATFQTLANKINGHGTGEIQSPANRAGGCQQLIGCQGQRRHDFMILHSHLEPFEWNVSIDRVGV